MRTHDIIVQLTDQVSWHNLHLSILSASSQTDGLQSSRQSVHDDTVGGLLIVDCLRSKSLALHWRISFGVDNKLEGLQLLVFGEVDHPNCAIRKPTDYLIGRLANEEGVDRSTDARQEISAQIPQMPQDDNTFDSSRVEILAKDLQALDRSCMPFEPADVVMNLRVEKTIDNRDLSPLVSDDEVVA